jgi:hypothetical protein
LPEQKLLGDRRFKIGNYNSAATHYSEAIELHPSHVLYSNRSACYCGLYQYELALRDASKCIDLDEKWPKGYHRKGAALQGLNKLDEAIATYEKGLEVGREIGLDNKGLEMFESGKKSAAQAKSAVEAAAKVKKEAEEEAEAFEAMAVFAQEAFAASEENLGKVVLELLPAAAESEKDISKGAAMLSGMEDAVGTLNVSSSPPLIEIALHVYSNHYSVPFDPPNEDAVTAYYVDYEPVPSESFAKVSGIKSVHRPNHGLANALRKASLVPEVASAFREKEGDRFNYSASMIQTMQTAMLFEVSGRKSDIGFNDDPGPPNAFMMYHALSCAAFKESTRRQTRLVRRMRPSASMHSSVCI